MIRFVVLLAVLCVCDGVKFGQLCNGNSANTIRTPDTTYGAGHYGASRVGGTHKGLDIKCRDGSVVYAPFDVTLTRGVVVYANDDNGRKAPINKGIRMSGEGLCFSLFYVDPDRTSGAVLKGQRIGVMLPMQTVYRGIDSHVHVQMCDKTNPTQYF